LAVLIVLSWILAAGAALAQQPGTKGEDGAREAGPPETEPSTPAGASPQDDLLADDEDITDALFPEMKERDAIPIPPDFGYDHELWGAANEATIRLAGIDPERLDDVYGTVDGTPITYREVVEEAVLRFGEQFVNDYRGDLIMLAEILGAGVEVTEKDLEIGSETFWTQLRQKGINNWQQLRRRYNWTEEFFRWKVFLNEGGEKVFAADFGEEEEGNEEEEVNPFFKHVWMSEIVARYPMVTRYGPGGNDLPDGVLAMVGERPIRAMDVAPYLLPNLKQFHFDMAFESLAERQAVLDELAELGVVVTDDEVQARVEEERARYADNLFGYEAMLQFQETNLVMERRKFRAWLAYNKLHGTPTGAELREHFDRNPVYFGRGAVAAAEIKTTALDPETGRLKGPDAWEKALERIREAEQELRSGQDFARVVMRYSENPATKKYKQETLFGNRQRRVAGSIGIFPIKSGRMTDEIATAAFLCPKGEWIGPVRSRDGYHLVQVVDVKDPRDMPFEEEPYTDINGNGKYDPGEPHADLNGNGHWNPGQRDIVLDDFQSERVGRWVADIVARAEIVTVDRREEAGAPAPEDEDKPKEEKRSPAGK